MPYSYAVQGMPYTLCAAGVYVCPDAWVDSLLGPEDSNQVCRLREPSRSVMLQQNDKLSNAPEDGCVQKGGECERVRSSTSQRLSPCLCREQ